MRWGEEEDGEQPETEETFRKFGINLGSFRMEAEILAEEEEQMDGVLETIRIVLTGTTSPLRRISIGTTRLVPALEKMMEAAV